MMYYNESKALESAQHVQIFTFNQFMSLVMMSLLAIFNKGR